jgi:hypothetical protein
MARSATDTAGCRTAHILRCVRFLWQAARYIVALVSLNIARIAGL